MNNIPTLRWPVSLFALLAFVLTAKQATAQCTISFIPPQPVTLTLNLSNAGTATLDAGTVPTIGTNSGCGLVFSPNTSFSPSYTTYNFGCADIATSPHTWYVRAQDANPANNSAVVTLRIFIVDNLQPSLGCPPSTTYSADPGFCTYQYTNANPQPTFSDNCAGSASLSWVMSGANTGTGTGLPFTPSLNLGTTSVTFVAQDGVGLTSSCNFLITVEDNEDPIVGCPLIGYNAFPNDMGVCGAALTFAANADDNCGNVIVTYDASGTANFSGVGTEINEFFDVAGITTITFTATDESGLTATCSFEVEVEDIEDPIIACPADITVQLDAACNYFVTGTDLDATATDNCGGSGLFFTNDWNGNNTLDTEVFFGAGTLSITWTAEDAYTNTGTCSFNITFEDNIDPVVAAFGGTTTVNVTPGDCSAVVTFQRPSVELQGGPIVTDNCTPGVNILLTQGTPTVNGVPTPGLIPAYDPNLPQGLNNAVVQFPVGTTIIPFTWEDESGNQTTQTVTIIVNENEDPTAKCKPGIVNVPLDAIGVATLTPDMVNDGSFDNCGSVVLTVTSPAGITSGVNTLFDCADLGNRTYTLTVSDVAVPANTASCTGTVKIIDNTAPVVNCPTNITVGAGAGCETPASAITKLAMTLVAPDRPLTGPGQYKDNCGAPAITYAIINPDASLQNGTYPIPAGKQFQKGSTIITYTFMDADGNNTVCSFTVNVVDQTAPVWSGVGQAPNSTITLNANNGGCLRQVTWTPPTFTDNCPGLVNVTSNRAPGEFFAFGTTPVVYTASDAAGNINADTFFVKIVDTQAPVARCKTNFTIQLGNAFPVTLSPDSIDNGSSDNCFFTLSVAPNSFDCTNIGQQTVTLTVTDGNLPANVRTCTTVVSIEDKVAPQAVCAAAPLTFAVNANGEVTVNASTINGNSSDNCTASGNLTLSVSKNGSTFAPFVLYNCSEVGTRTVTLSVSDAQGNTATCTKSVSIIDNLPPTAVAPANVTISCTQLPYSSALVSTADNCGTPTVTALADVQNNIVCPNTYNLVRSWRVTDANGNSTVVSQTISVQDNQAPVFKTISSVSVNTTDADICDVAVNYVLTADSLSDNCSAFANIDKLVSIDYPINNLGYVDITTPVVYTPALLQFFPLGTTTVRFTAVDQCGRSSSKTLAIHVLDAQGPLYGGSFGSVCGQVFTKTNTPGSCSNTHQWARPTNSLPGDESVIDCGGLASVTESFTDNNGAPVSSISVTPFNFFNPNFLSLFPAAQFPVGITHVTYVATDLAGNTSSCRFTVEVQDNQAPTLTCPPQQILPATCPTAVVPDYRNLVGVADNCQSSVTLTQAFAAGVRLDSIFKAPNVPAAGKMFDVVITGKDKYNTTTCTFKVVLADGTAPIPALASLPMLIDSCGALSIDAPIANDPCNPTATVIYGSPSAPVGQFVPGTPPRYNLLVGNYVITWVYNDGNGNISTQPQNITVLADVFPPVAVCKKSLTLDLNAAGMASLTTAQVDSGSVDLNDCGMITLALSKSTFNCTNLGMNNIVLTVKDTNNNMAVCTTKVLIRDVTLPMFSSVPMDTVINACAAIPSAATLTATDLCDANVPVMYKDTSSQALGGFGKYNYTIVREWKAADDSGNSISAIQVIAVQDTTKPAFAANLPSVLKFKTAGNATNCSAAVHFDAKKYITDCATGVDLRITSNPAGFTNSDTTETLPLGIHVYQIIAKDTSGNISTHNVQFEVEDGTIPTAACINGISVSLQTAGSVSITTAQVDASSFDNCTIKDSLNLLIQRLTAGGAGIGLPALSITFTCPDADGVTKHKVKLFVKDKAGNESTCETFVVVQDNAPPTITFCPPSKTILCTQSIDPSQNNNGTLTATDNCQGNVAITSQDVIVNGTGAACLTVTRTWQAKDGAGNTATCVQTFTVSDLVPPTFSALPADATVNCSDPLVTAPTLTATDDCSSAADIAIDFKEVRQDSAAGNCGKYSYTVVRTWKATDKCGNATTHTQQIKVTDMTAPLFLGLPDTLRFFSANFAANLNCTVPVALNLGQYLSDCSPDSNLVVTHTLAQAPNGINIAATLPVGDYPVFLTATDVCGNLRRDTIVISTIDNSIPTVICNDNVVIALGSANMAELKVSDIDLGSTDNCGIDTMILAPNVFNCSNIGKNNVTLTVTDIHGNVNFCDVSVEVTLGSNPGITVDATATPTSAFGASDGTATVTVSNGSGSYLYTWSTGDTTATINGLPSGFYIINVVDSTTLCQGVDTAFVDDGPQIIIVADSISGAQEAIINVPVTVELFKNIYAFRFDAAVQDTTVGKIVGVTNIEPSLAGMSTTVDVDGTLTVLFAKIDSFMLNDGTVLFEIQVKLGKLAPIASSPLLLTNVEVIQGLGNGPETVAVTTFDGAVTINQAANKLDIGGDIVTWRNPSKPVPGVVVSLSGSKTGTQTTDALGTYLFNSFAGDTTIVTCSKSTPGNGQVTAADLLLIQNYIFGAPLASPYQWVAADVDGNGNITLLDYVRISTVVLGTNQHLPGNTPDWKFIPKSYVFPTPNPLSVAPPQSIRRDSLNAAALDDDFIAVRMGDVNGNVIPSLISNVGEDRSGETFRFRIPEQSFEKGDVIRVPFKASDFTGRQAYQMTINFDPTVLALDDMAMGALPGLKNDNFGTAHLSNGQLTTVWTSVQPVTLQDDAVLFTLTFRALRSGNALASVLRPGSEITSAESYDREGRTMPVDFEFTKSNGTESAVFALYQNQPNPFNNTTTIGFRLPEDARATVRVFNANGQLVRTVVGDYHKGYNEARFRAAELGAPGVYYYEVETPTHSERRKMVVALGE